MIQHIELGDTDFARKRALLTLIAKGEIALGGYIKGKIYGTISCRSGKRMKPENRIFFTDEQEAISAGYRPCAHCMPEQYKQWKSTNGTI